MGPPGDGAKVEKWPKVSRAVTFVRLSRSFGFKNQLNAPFRSKTAKKLYFPIFSIVFYSKTMEKEKCRFLNPLHPLPEAENLHTAF